jgi:hypothetical protein
MSMKTEKKIASIRKKLKCNLPDCGKFIKFESSEHHEKFVNFYDRTYKGICSRCGIKLKLKASDLNFFNANFGQSSLIIYKSTLDEVLDIEPKK